MESSRHPPGLYVLFFTEMWERFSYYGMRALLVLYMVNYLKWTQEDASRVYKWYTSLVYLTPILGGYLADRYLGNKRAVVIGSVLMAIGQFLLAFEALASFYSALVFLIIGNGFFKPNMSTQVGRLYPPNDARRDGAYTIFYMGINLGAGISPLVCGWLADKWGFHWGFVAAGVGMICGLIIYLAGQPWVIEVVPAVAAAKAPTNVQPSQEASRSGRPSAASEEEAARTPSAAPFLNRAGPPLMSLVGYALAGLVTCAAAAKVAGLRFGGWFAPDSLVSLGITSGCALISSWILLRTHNGVRDRVLAIYVLGIFVVCFWAAFEQAGNAMTIWADKTTNRYLTAEAPQPRVFPGAMEGAAAASASQSALELLSSQVNPVPTTWFQSINAAAIFLLAPLFSMLWTALDRRKRNPSIPTKMAIGVLLMGAGFGVMVLAAKVEDRPSSTSLSAVPESIRLNAAGQLCEAAKDGRLVPYHAGRLRFNAAARSLEMTGVLPDIERDRIARATAPESFSAKAEELKRRAEEATGERFEAAVVIDEEPPGLDLRYAGLAPEALSYDRTTRTLKAAVRLGEKDVKGLLVAAADPVLRDALNELLVKSSAYRVSSWWLFWFYILSTLGELCLSPVGLSMVSKLAPARFATMLMGLWLLTTFFGNFAAGAMGEIWGTVAPTPYFLILVVALGAASVVLFTLVRKIVAMMHGVN